MGTTPNELAEELQVPAKEIRRYLRQAHPRSDSEKHQRWSLDDRVVGAVRQHFRSRR